MRLQISGMVLLMSCLPLVPWPSQVSGSTDQLVLEKYSDPTLINFVRTVVETNPRVQEIRSVSLFGLSYVAVYFDDGMDIYFARRLVMERLQEVGDRIPEGYGTPEMGPNTSGLGQVFWYTLERKIPRHPSNNNCPKCFRANP